VRKLLAISCFLVLAVSFTAQSQHSLAFQQLRNGTFQSTNYNAAWMPEGVLFIGLPAVSGVGFYLNNRFSYNNLFTDQESGSKLLNVNNLIGELGVNNMLNANLNVNLFHLGVRTPSGVSLALFANERIEADFTYPKNLVDWVWNGNAAFIARDVSLGKLGLTANYFREYGVGIAIDKPDIGLKFGARAKYYQGLVNASTPWTLDVDILTENENFQINLENKDLIVRTAGIETLQDGNNIVNYLLSNGNRGFGVDFGFERKLNKYYTVAVGVTDLGFISWKEAIKNYSVADTSMRYVGVQLKGIRDLAQTVQDSLLDRFGVDTTFESYRTAAVAGINGHFIYTPLPYLDVITSASARIIQGQPKASFGVGLRGHLGPKLIASANINRLPQQFLNIGAALTVSPGPVQFYLAVDKVLGYSVPNMQWAEAKLGINFVFGNKTRSREARNRAQQAEEDRLITEPKGIVSGTFMGSKIDVKGNDGIYTIINKQPRSEARTITPVVVNGDHKPKSIQSNTGKDRSDHKPKGVQSATGQNRSSYQKKGIRSASGQVFKNDYKAKKVGSATGNKSKSFKKKKTKIRSASGGAQRSGGKKKTKIRTSGGRKGGSE
jgi:hypothetical protein